jgi:hypothetical protein
MSAEWELKHLGQDISDLDFLAPPETVPADQAPGAEEPAAKP